MFIEKIDLCHADGRQKFIKAEIERAMLNYIWFGLLAAGFVVAVFNGRLEQATQALLKSSAEATELCIGLLGVMCLWSGLMNIARESGLIRLLARIMQPAMKFLFPGIPKGHPAAGAVIMNLAANFLGLGNAATPLGIKAMTELQRLNPLPGVSTDAMSMFLVLNTSAIQLVPATIIAVRSASGSVNAVEVVASIWVASLCATIAGVASAKIMSGHGKGAGGSMPARKAAGKRNHYIRRRAV